MQPSNKQTWVQGGTYTYTETTTSYETTSYLLLAYAIQVRWRADDMPNLQTHPLTPGASPSPLPGATSTNTSSAATSTANSGGGGMSTSSKVGIGLGVPLSILAIAGLASFFFFYLLRRRRRRRQQPNLHHDDPGNHDLPEVHYTSLPHNKGGAPGSNSWQDANAKPSNGVPPSLSGGGRDSRSGSAVWSEDAATTMVVPASGRASTLASSVRQQPLGDGGTSATTTFAPFRMGLFGEGAGSGGSEAGDVVHRGGGGSSEHGGSVGGGGAGAKKDTIGSSPSSTSLHGGDDTDEIVRLRREARRLRERRQRLTEMQQLDEEEERVTGRLRELEERGVVY
ncbi:hypothetical protein SLS55_002851 [Diplodia seriata]|uniref:Uncharacterized protein n=1 Tax=Diplodia seriata TaxID=420778 RepID=A0ABR3CM98_9PEZI